MSDIIKKLLNRVFSNENPTRTDKPKVDVIVKSIKTLDENYVNERIETIIKDNKEGIEYLSTR